MPPIFVTAAEGRAVPLHSSDLAGPGRTQVVLRAGDVVQVNRSALIVRSINRGDLVEVAPPAKEPAV